ncbi:MAG: HNH endonuclease [Ruminococcus sp.]|nr:HNH endonuclease [Ruminococcus sp.]
MNGYRRECSVHRLVALAFIPNPENKPTVNHLNEDKKDNRVENLECATNAEQNVHGTRIECVIAHTDCKNRAIDYAAVALNMIITI